MFVCQSVSQSTTQTIARLEGSLTFGAHCVVGVERRGGRLGGQAHQAGRVDPPVGARCGVAEPDGLVVCVGDALLVAERGEGLDVEVDGVGVLGRGDPDSGVVDHIDGLCSRRKYSVWN